MTNNPEVFIAAAVRSAIGTYGGTLKDTPLSELATLAVKTALARSGAPADAIGHPVGATGAIITTKALYELQRIGGRYALATMCIGGGQGIAAIFERV